MSSCDEWLYILQVNIRYRLDNYLHMRSVIFLALDMMAILKQKLKKRMFTLDVSITIIKTLFCFITFLAADIPCPDGEFLLARTVSPDMKTFSTCTQKQIDYAYEKRDQAKKNCLFT